MPRGTSRRQFAAFVVVGIVSAVLSLAVRYAANLVIAFEASVVVAHIVGMLFSFGVNRLAVFPSSDRPVWDELGRFTLVNVVSLLLATGVSSWLYRVGLPAIRFAYAPALTAHFLGLAACTLPSFLGHKLFSFRATADTRGTEPRTESGSS
ncbi:putative flippase GtrA [Kaistia hirudinis]|uniref:Putative flippase GtrA n=1 Tax=Kaistia hirudinis TaxID=1293440 RepID=A0A840AQV7_9HYPH|nr:GtrA family protein [Kaistia hirudinis]MBB3932740.1 putative flippase GtrA [Kaistia hirudinis]